MLRDDFLDDIDGLGEVALRWLDLKAEVELRLNELAEEADGVDLDLGRHDLVLAALTHLTRKRLVGFSEGVFKAMMVGESMPRATSAARLPCVVRLPMLQGHRLPRPSPRPGA